MPDIDYVQKIQDALNKGFESFLKAELPDLLITTNLQGDIVVDGIDVGLQRTEQAAAGGEPVAGHWRRSKGGKWTWITPHSKRKEMPSAMELAELEAKEEISPTLGFSIEEKVQKFLQTLQQPNSLQRFL